MPRATTGRRANGTRPRRSGEGNTRTRGVFDDILSLAGTLAGSRKDYAAEKLEAIAGTVRELSSQLPSIPNVESYATAAADSLEELAGYVTESDLPTMVADARNFARRHPLAVLAGSIAAGVVVAQMIQMQTAPLQGGRRKSADE